MASVTLGNGDDVGVTTSWEWPDPFDGITVNDLRAAQKAVAAGGPWQENFQAKEWVGSPNSQGVAARPQKQGAR